jgi:hypothetical protein
MSLRNGNVSFNAGTFAPKKYAQYTVEYTATPSGGYISTYRYYGTVDDTSTLMAALEIEFDSEGRDIRGNLLEI